MPTRSQEASRRELDRRISFLQDHLDTLRVVRNSFNTIDSVGADDGNMLSSAMRTCINTFEERLAKLVYTRYDLDLAIEQWDADHPGSFDAENDTPEF